MRRAGLLLLLAVFSSFSEAEELSGPRLVEELRKGGYVLYLRHASTDYSQADAKMAPFEDCASQRNLTDGGREQARAIAGHIQRLGIPIGRVFSSPYCRTLETAMLAFGRAERAAFATGSPGRPDEPRAYEELRRLLSLPVEPGGNRVVSGHGPPFRMLTWQPQLIEGEFAVVRPGGKHGFETVARIRPADWETLAP